MSLYTQKQQKFKNLLIFEEYFKKRGLQLKWKTKSDARYKPKSTRFALSYRPSAYFLKKARGSVSEQGWWSAFEVMQYLPLFYMKENLSIQKFLHITCISDMHGEYNRLNLPGGDLLICAGDSQLFLENCEQTLNDGLQFCEWLNKQQYTQKIFVAGNHDLVFEKYDQQIRSALINYPSVKYLKNEYINIEINGTQLQIFGSSLYVYRQTKKQQFFISNEESRSNIVNGGYNQFKNIYPIQNLVNLTWLDLHSNRFEDFSPLAQLVKLEALFLLDCQLAISASQQNQLKLVNLETLNISLSDQHICRFYLPQPSYTYYYNINALQHLLNKNIITFKILFSIRYISLVCILNFLCCWHHL
ncbi:Calcineurin-like_phosphoesterase [Hexamita inflata]|uniref:Calcineurin-like phosphoesterase n=1 Tax=Hexamita inflata TaxID=28002 RepID=A0AA86RSA2_9EUKA|nr:Calcineurin-like phosphoesterase [Hexamita inflata]CAI9977089.1 Calcineurin-like phosphoesterase [Hexamita inflata]